MSNLSQPMRDVIMGATDEGLLTVGAARTVTALKTRGLVDDSGLNLTDAGKAVRAELIAPDQGDVNPPVEQYADWERELLAYEETSGATFDDFLAVLPNLSPVPNGDERIAEYLSDESDTTYLDRNYVPGDMTGDDYHALTTETASQNAGDETNTAPEGEVCNDPTCWACAPEDSADGTDTTSEGDTAIDPVNAAQGVSDASENTREAVPGLEKLLDTPHVVPNRKDKRNRRRIVRAFNRLFARKRDAQTKKRTDAAKAARKRGRKVAA